LALEHTKEGVDQQKAADPVTKPELVKPFRLASTAAVPEVPGIGNIPMSASNTKLSAPHPSAVHVMVALENFSSESDDVLTGLLQCVLSQNSAE
jgi:hypothetical protein